MKRKFLLILLLHNLPKYTTNLAIVYWDNNQTLIEF